MEREQLAVHPKEERYTYVSLNHCSLLSSTASSLSSFADKLSGVMHGMVSAPASASPNRFKGYIRRYHAQEHTNTSMRLRNMRAFLLSYPCIHASSTPSHQLISLTFQYDPKNCNYRAHQQCNRHLNETIISTMHILFMSTTS